MVMATAFGTGLSRGRRIQFGPSNWLRGQSPAPANATWFAATAPSAHGQARGLATTVAAAATCSATDAVSSGLGTQRVRLFI
jgi:hypothetical protein